HPANFTWLARRLRRDGWRHLYLVAHTPVGGDIERSAHRLGEALDRLRRATGASRVDIVAHSMGGLVARACIRARGQASGVGRLITLGTPHQGTEIFPRFRLDPMVAQMRPGSPLLACLAADDPVPRLVDCISIYSADDAVVVPASRAYYPGAFNIEVRGLGHLSLLFSQSVYALVRENPPAEPPPATGSRSPTCPRASRPSRSSPSPSSMRTTPWSPSTSRVACRATRSTRASGARRPPSFSRATRRWRASAIRSRRASSTASTAAPRGCWS